MKKNRIRLFFIVLVGFLFFQFLFSLKFSEPYPAIKFPGFGKIPQSSGKIKFDKFAVLAYSKGQGYDSINTEKLFENIPPVFVLGLLNNIIKKHNKKPSNKAQQDYANFKSWMFSRLHTIYNKDYYKVEIRKLQVVKEADIKDSKNEVSLSEKTDILL